MSSLKKDQNGQPPLTGRDYWRSLDDLAQTPEFQEKLKREFPAVATEVIAPQSRRDFLKYMGASLALAGLTLTGCRWPEEKIAPYANRPAGLTPGQSVQYATALELGGAAVGLLVTSYDGRPVKVEGNPQHPASLGAANSWHQASLLDLYDPSRTKHPVRINGGNQEQLTATQRDEYLAGLAGKYAASRGQGLVVLCEGTSSPSVLAMRRRLLEQLPEAQLFVYDPVSRDNDRLALKKIYGSYLRPVHRLGKARVIAAFDDDFLISHPNSVRYAHDFAQGRKVHQGGMNRLYAIESAFTLTGMAADHRVPVTSVEVVEVLSSLALVLASRLPGISPENVSPDLFSGGLHEELLAALARDLLANRGTGLITVGPRQPAAAHALAHKLNLALGNLGETVTLIDDPRDDAGDAAAITGLIDALNDGGVETLVVAGGNPAYTTPELVPALGKAGEVVYLSLYDTETTAHATVQINQAHYLEAWGDARAWDGTYSVVQPLIAPLYGGLSEPELLARLAGAETRKGYDIVRRTFGGLYGGLGDEAPWRTALHDGLVQRSESALRQPEADFSSLKDDLSRIGPTKHTGQPIKDIGLEVVLVPDHCVYDGRFANNGWLQELPDPVTKLAWDNAAQLNPADARELGVVEGDLLELSAGGKTLKVPVYIMPGQARGSVTIPLGYGRHGDLTSWQNAKLDALHPDFKKIPRGVVCAGVGVNAYALRGMEQRMVLGGVTAGATGEKHKLVSTQDSHAIDMVGFKEREKRVGQLVREANVGFYNEHPDFAQRMTHHPPLITLWKEHAYDGHRWGMAIDLNSCIGCGACTVACQAENNIPVVGRRRVAEGREMHWIRVDRYFSGDEEAPQAVHQPLACHHCELAPCEQVCPVAATVHSDEGLNDMVYNRCVGTRYCANNCPYKVRRFNYFAYDQDLSETEKMKFNPEVTVRSRGVMEKCTYCVQRIQNAKIGARRDGRDLVDGDVVPACAQTCPAQAITFGDLNDPNSKIYKMHADDRSYAILAELNIKPRTAYLAKLRNPAPGTPEYEQPGPALHAGGHGEVEHGATDGPGAAEHDGGEVQH